MIYSFDETDNGRPMYWTCDEASIGPYGDGSPRCNPDSAPDLTDDATGGVLLGLLRGLIHVGYRQQWVAGGGCIQQYHIWGRFHTSGWCSNLAEACARYALARGYWRL